MKVIELGLTKNQFQCDCCKSIVEIEPQDLQWTHNEEQYYYVICPVCGEKIWIKGNEYYDEMWNQKISLEK